MKDEIAKKWQKYWDEHETFKAIDNSEKEKYYYLVEFPYPSGSGLHVGHVRGYSAMDALARKKRLEGYNVLFPIGWDAFGLPAEQYAIKNHIYPEEAVKKNIEVFKKQIKELGISFDWSREFSTTDPDYYKWTQWQFLEFFKRGMAYKEKKTINWCPHCKISLSNEESSGGVCERCGGETEQRDKEQWLLRMKDYAEDLLRGLDDTLFDEKIKTAQINWIGKSQGTEIDFSIKDEKEKLKVFTTRPDTIYGVTFMVIAPEHPLIEKLKKKITNINEIKEYQKKVLKETSFERIELHKYKDGLKIEGIEAINPVTKKEIPIYTASYVMMSYGTGAIMAVPAHDERDYDFATKYKIEVLPVISGDKLPYIGDGEYINSPLLKEADSKEEAIKIMNHYLMDNNLGEEKINYKLQDWLFSRQRFWGEPIPLIKCPSCGWVPVKEEDLPVKLPYVESYEPTDTGESPLSNIEKWVNVKCPKCGKDAKRETDTMPNWAGSSWYFLRYIDPHNSKEFVNKDKAKYWGQVDWYNGGMEHTTRHLLYARFWNQFLYNEGLVPYKEPFKVRMSHGTILGPDGEKMSKSKGNVINPQEMSSKYGVDALRCYELFISDYEKEVMWSEKGLNGCKRFLDKVIRLEDIVDKEKDTYTENLEKDIHQTIKGVTDDFNSLKFNTAISKIMILTRSYENNKKISKKDYQVLLTLLNPIAPHLTEELNEHLGYKPICESSWPQYSEDKVKEVTKIIGVQVNGKLRDELDIHVDEDEESIRERALKLTNIIKFTKDKTIVKVIVIKGKIVNVVVK